MIPNLIDAVKIVEYQLRHKIHPCIENPGAKLKKKKHGLEPQGTIITQYHYGCEKIK